MKLKNLLASATIATAMLAASAANAAPLLFNFVGAPGQTGSFTFNIDSNPTPISPDNDSFIASITNATGSVANDNQIEFFTPTVGGGLANGSQSVNLFGSQLFTGTTNAPQFSLGSFTLFNQDPTTPGSTVQGTLTISSVPEPATWAMMMVGFGMIGFGLRRRSKVSTTVRYA